MVHDGTVRHMASVGLPNPGLLYFAKVVVERGGLALIAGLGPRWAAGGWRSLSLAAALCFHHNFADLNQLIHFMKNVSMIGGLLQVSAFGPGTISLDARRNAA